MSLLNLNNFQQEDGIMGHADNKRQKRQIHVKDSSNFKITHTDMLIDSNRAAGPSKSIPLPLLHPEPKNNLRRSGLHNIARSCQQASGFTKPEKPGWLLDNPTCWES